MAEDRLQVVLERLECVRKSGDDEWSARCPAHDDRNPSLSVGRGKDGRVLLKCHRDCTAADICKALGLRLIDLFPPKDRNGKNGQREVAAYNYCDADGTLLYQVVRYVPRTFKVRRPDGKGGWIWKLGQTPRVLYLLPELLAADPREWVVVAEGEKDCDRLTLMGFVATTNSGGAGNWKTLSDDSALNGRRIAIIADKDEPGRRHARDVARRLANRVEDLRVLELPGAGKDASDWADAGGTPEALLELIEAAPHLEPGDVAQEPRSGGQTRDADGVPKPGTIDPETGRLVLSTTRTLPTAESYVKQFHEHADGRMLHHYAGVFLAWDGARFAEIEDAALRARLLPWLHEAVQYIFRKNDGWVPADFPACPATVGAALESIAEVAYLPASVTTPAWLVDSGAGGHRRPEPREILCCRTYMLHLPTMERLEPTPAFFSTSALDYDPQPDAAPPERWLGFLGEVIGEDPQSWDLLQDWFGYCLTGDTSQQKMLLLVGPRRSGKGTIARVLTRLVGPANVCGPTATSLAGSFGLQPLLGKSLAIVSDARFSGRDMSTVVERLLCISGEDTLTVDRKHQTSVTMKLPTRFMFLTNELPKLTDVSGALAGRFVILRFSQSFYGREDRGLTERLLAELPGILNWAIEGWHRLDKRGHFVHPASVEEAIRELEDLASPAGAFVRERIDVGPSKRAEPSEVWTAWKAWCEDQGRSPGTKQRLGRDLAAVVPGLRLRQGTYGRFYEGIALKGSSVP